jgi:hypothetical protein
MFLSKDTGAMLSWMQRQRKKTIRENNCEQNKETDERESPMRAGQLQCISAGRQTGEQTNVAPSPGSDRRIMSMTRRQ